MEQRLEHLGSDLWDKLFEIHPNTNELEHQNEHDRSDMPELSQAMRLKSHDRINTHCFDRFSVPRGSSIEHIR